MPFWMQDRWMSSLILRHRYPPSLPPKCLLFRSAISTTRSCSARVPQSREHARLFCIREPRVLPRERLINWLHMEINGDRLAYEEAIANAIGTMVDGQETTTLIRIQHGRTAIRWVWPSHGPTQPFRHLSPQFVRSTYVYTRTLRPRTSALHSSTNRISSRPYNECSRRDLRKRC